MHMKYESLNQTVMLKVKISKDEIKRAKSLAKSEGMLFQCWLGNLVRKELQNNTPEKTIVEPVDGQSVSYVDRRSAE